MGHIYAAPYALLEPQLALVVEDDDGIGGFAVGTTDTIPWEKRLEWSWWPALSERYHMPAQSDASEWTPDQWRAFMIHRQVATPAAVAVRYPAHLHLNLLPRLHGRGVGRTFFEYWLRLAGSAGAMAVHVGVDRANAGAASFWRKMGFADLARDRPPSGRTLWQGEGDRRPWSAEPSSGGGVRERRPAPRHSPPRRGRPGRQGSRGRFPQNPTPCGASPPRCSPPHAA